ncbi:hypothetical protein ACLOJK_008619 [Asimina triloba]
MPASHHEILQPKINKNSLVIVVASSLTGESCCLCYFFNGGHKPITNAIFFLGFGVAINKNPTRERRERKSEFCSVFLIYGRATHYCQWKTITASSSLILLVGVSIPGNEGYCSNDVDFFTPHSPARKWVLHGTRSREKSGVHRKIGQNTVSRQFLEVLSSV